MQTVDALGDNPLRTVTQATSAMRLSLSGAQSKLAWYLPEGLDAETASASDWLVPRGTAPSSHIIKVCAPGEEETALNEHACALIAQSCGIQTAKTSLLPFLPGALAVERYDRTWIERDGERVLTRLHQEDFCQALGLPPHLKYQVEGTDCSYPLFAADLIDAASSEPRADRLEFAKRLAFNYAVGNADAHLKNSSLLYNPQWTGRRLSPLYDVTCIPLTGYSTRMAFDIGRHRALSEIDERDILAIALDLDVGLTDFDAAIRCILDGFARAGHTEHPREIQGMLERILENAADRLGVLERFVGGQG